MARRKSQGIGLIASPSEFFNLRRKILSKLYNLEIYEGWNNAKKNSFIAWINASTGRSAGEETITDFYQVMFCTFLPAVYKAGFDAYGNSFTYDKAAKKTNTLVAKLATVGQYGNTGVVRRQTTLAKLKQNLHDRSRIFVTRTAFESYQKLNEFLFYTVTITEDESATAFEVEKQILNLRGSRSRRRASTTTTTPRRSTTTTTTPRRSTTTTTTPTSTSQQDLTRYLRDFNDAIGDERKFKTLVSAFRMSLRQILEISSATNSTKLPLNLLDDAFSLVVTSSVGNVLPREYIKLKNQLRVIAFCMGGWDPKIAKKIAPISLFQQGQRREFTKVRLSSMTINIFDGRLSPRRTAQEVIDLVTGGGSGSTTSQGIPTNTWQDVRMAIMRGIAYSSISEMPTVGDFRRAMSLETAEMVRESSSVTQVRDDNPRSTVPPEASQTRTLVKETPFRGTVGIEIEYYGVSDRVIIEYCKRRGVQVVREGYNHSTRDYWKLVNDVTQGTGGSGEAGELVSPVLKGKSGLAQMRKCLMGVNEAGMLVNKDGGLHVHFGVRNYSVQTIKNIIVNYNGFQGLIDKMLNPYRRNNRWAKPFNSRQIDAVKRANSMNDIFNAISGRTRGSWTQSDNRDNARYHVVNVFCYLKYGTLEFRQHASNIETDTTLMWVYFLHFLIEASKKKELSNYSWKNLENILPKRIGTFWANRVYELSGGTDQVVRDFSDRRKVTNV